MPRTYLQQGAIEARMMSDIRLPVGLSAAVPVHKGDQLTENCLVQPAQSPAAAGKTAGKTELSEEHYTSGVKYFQNADYAKARDEWRQALKLDPKNTGAAAGLARIKAITGK